MKNYNWDTGLAMAILAGNSEGRIETEDEWEEVIGIVTNGAGRKWDYTVTLRDNFTGTLREEQYTWDIQAGLRPGHWGQSFEPGKVLKIKSPWLTYDDCQVLMKDDIYIILGKFPSKYEIYARVLFDESTGELKHNTEIPGSLSRYSPGSLETLRNKINRSCPPEKRWNPWTFDIEDLPSPGDILYCKVYSPTTAYPAECEEILGIVEEANPTNKTVSLSTALMDGCIVSFTKRKDVSSYRAAEEKEKEEFESALKTWGRILGPQGQVLLDKAAQPEFGDYVLVRDDRPGRPWEIAQFAFFEETRTERIIHTIGGFQWMYWIPYKGNEDKLGKQ